MSKLFSFANLSSTKRKKATDADRHLRATLQTPLWPQPCEAAVLLVLRLAPPHTGSPRTPEESEKSPERVPRGRAPKVPKECAPESQKSPKRVQKSGFRLFSGSFGTPGRTLSALLGPCPGVLFRDSSGVLRPEGPGRPCVGRGQLQY